MKKELRALIGICTLLSFAVTANINLDDFKLHGTITYSYSSDQQELVITVRDVRVSCQSGTAPLGRLVGSFPNPSYQPYHKDHEGFKPGSQSPYCLVYSAT